MGRERYTRREAWSRIFRTTDIEARLNRFGRAEITTEDFRRAIGMGPRTFAKSDCSADLPPQLTDRCILPVRNGRYAVFEGNGYASVPQRPDRVVGWPREKPPCMESMPDGFERILGNETHAVSFAHETGILADFFTAGNGERIRARPSCGSTGEAFSFVFANGFGEHVVEVNGVQVQVDRYVETDSAIWPMEVKTGWPADFNTRQIFYPARVQMQRGEVSKPVRGALMCVRGDGILLVDYEFTDPLTYNAVRPVRSVFYELGSERRNEDVHGHARVDGGAPTGREGRTADVAWT